MNIVMRVTAQKGSRKRMQRILEVEFKWCFFSF